MDDDTNHPTTDQQIVFINDVEKMMGRNRLTLRRWWLEGRFPTPVKLNGTNLAWNIKTIMNWIQQNTIH